MCNFHSSKTKPPKIMSGRFSGLKLFSSDILSSKLTKFTGHFRNLAFLSDRPAVFAKTACTGAYVFDCISACSMYLVDNSYCVTFIYLINYVFISIVFDFVE